MSDSKTLGKPAPTSPAPAPASPRTEALRTSKAEASHHPEAEMFALWTRHLPVFIEERDYFALLLAMERGVYVTPVLVEDAKALLNPDDKKGAEFVAWLQEYLLKKRPTE